MLNWSCIHLAVYLSTQVLLDSVKFSFRREIKSTRLYIQVATQGILLCLYKSNRTVIGVGEKRLLNNNAENK
ncbi:hypothetical protein NC653_017878 [Populus alba x Populus x berolinensis]|nr:hypothetical protein NC653_017878 [Populus alba x Populus x berolinensis]